MKVIIIRRDFPEGGQPFENFIEIVRELSTMAAYFPRLSDSSVIQFVSRKCPESVEDTTRLKCVNGGCGCGTVSL